MKLKLTNPAYIIIFVITLILQSCGAQAPSVTAPAVPTNSPESPKAVSTSTLLPSFTPVQSSGLMPTQTPNLTATSRAEAWKTSQAGPSSKSTRTPRPTRTPNLAMTQQVEAWNIDTQTYFDKGYLPTAEGKFVRLDDFSEEWAQLGWYYRWPLTYSAKDFYMTGHLKWSSAYRTPDISGCGFVFAEQKNGDHYAVFLDRSKVLFVETAYYFTPIGTTRGTGRVNFGNPFDHPVEADLTLIVNDAYAYVLVDGEVVGEYTLSQSKILQGTVGLALLSGTNKDFGTRCEITNLHLWLPDE